MAKTNAERQAAYRAREFEVGKCTTGGCQQVAHPYRKCALCRRKEADQKAAKRRKAVEELKELDMLRDQVQKLEERNAQLEEEKAWLVQKVSALNKYDILADDYEALYAMLENEYEDG